MDRASSDETFQRITSTSKSKLDTVTELESYVGGLLTAVLMVMSLLIGLTRLVDVAA